MGRSFVSPREVEEEAQEKEKKKQQKTAEKSDLKCNTLNLMLMLLLKLKFVAVKRVHFDGIFNPKQEKKTYFQHADDFIPFQKTVNFIIITLNRFLKKKNKYIYAYYILLKQNVYDIIFK